MSLRAAKEQREGCGWLLNLPHSLLKSFNQLILLLLLFHPVHAGDDKLGDDAALGAGPGDRTDRDSGTSPDWSPPQTAPAVRILPREGDLSPQAAQTPPPTLALNFVGAPVGIIQFRAPRACVCLWT